MSSPKDTKKQDISHNGNSFENTELSPNMEDYMETISRLATKNRVVRVRDIARSLNITMPSVTAALGRLKEKKLILYEKYGHVELTTEGQKIADTVYRKHSFLREFFHDVLRMSRDTADSEACRMEHHLSPEACRQMQRFVNFYRTNLDSGEKWAENIRDILEEKALSDLQEGDAGVIVRIAGKSPFRKRLMEMGFRKGEQLRVIKYAPLRDPIELKIKGYYISLRIEEARDIIVKLLQDKSNGAQEA